MKTKSVCVGAVTMVLLSMALLSAPAEAKGYDKPDVTGIYDYNQNVTFSEIVVLQELDIGTGLLVDVEYGVDFDGTLFKLGAFVNETYDKVWYATKGPSAVLADWSDDLVLHKWKAGQQVRTEMVLRLPDIGATVYTIRAHFTIEHVADALGTSVIHEVYSGNVTEGLYADGPTDAYSAEINQLGNLLYGFNWDTKHTTTERGFYKLTFSIETDCWVPAAFPYIVSEYSDVTISDVADYAYMADGSAYTTAMDHDLMYTSIVIELL
ncbi:MAG: hypothetical protein QG582_684 [Candidatus Thermoplasmatota archaeon]|nr:hypothetical protein [Candidatus Thermoplasmatota archaeon]